MNTYECIICCKNLGAKPNKMNEMLSEMHMFTIRIQHIELCEMMTGWRRRGGRWGGKAREKCWTLEPGVMSFASVEWKEKDNNNNKESRCDKIGVHIAPAVAFGKWFNKHC